MQEAQAALKTIEAQEFQEHLAQYMDADRPLAITKYGSIISYYIPAHRLVREEDKQALTDAAKNLHTLLIAKGIDPETLMQDFKTLRKQRQRHG